MGSALRVRGLELSSPSNGPAPPLTAVGSSAVGCRGCPRARAARVPCESLYPEPVSPSSVNALTHSPPYALSLGGLPSKCGHSVLEGRGDTSVCPSRDIRTTTSSDDCIWRWMCIRCCRSLSLLSVAASALCCCYLSRPLLLFTLLPPRASIMAVSEWSPLRLSLLVVLSRALHHPPRPLLPLLPSLFLCLPPSLS